MKTQEEMIDAIKRYVDPAEARTLILDAYNAEIVSNRIGRLENMDPTKLTPFSKKDLMAMAISRVHDVVVLVQ